MTQQRLLTDLLDTWAGKPILVIGGGPSVATDIPALQAAPACVISANDHGAYQDRFPVDLFVNMDNEHMMRRVPMKSVLRPFEKPIINRFSWADYRLPDWKYAGSTGLACILIAAALGGDPVMVTGIDMWRGGRLYFHDLPGKRPSLRRRQDALELTLDERKRKLNPLTAAVKGANIRPLSGLLCKAFPQFDPGETLPPRADTAYRKHLRSFEPRYGTVVMGFSFGGNQDRATPGKVLALSPREVASKIPPGRVAFAK